MKMKIWHMWAIAGCLFLASGMPVTGCLCFIWAIWTGEYGDD